MMTLETAAELIAAAVFEQRGLVRPDPPSCHCWIYRASTVNQIRRPYLQAMIRAFELGEIRLHSASSFLPLDAASGVVAAVLAGRVQAPE